MTISRGRCPPPPPDKLRAALKIAPIHFNPEPCVRVFRKGRDPLTFARSSARGNRFDPLPTPWETTKVLYGGTSLETAVAETICRWQREVVASRRRVILSKRNDLLQRQVARFYSKRPLNVIDATGLGRALIQNIVDQVILQPKYEKIWGKPPRPIADDIFQCGVDEYALTQQWGAWFRSQHPDADGVQWVSRQFNVGNCIVLFEDCCGDQLQLAEPPVPLYAARSRERNVVEYMAGLLQWGIQ